MNKVKVLVVHISKKLYHLKDDNTKDIVASSNTIMQEVYGNVDEFEENDFMLAFIKGSLHKTHHLKEYYLHDFNSDSILDFNVMFNLADEVFVFLDYPRVNPIIELIRSVNFDKLNVDEIRLHGTGCLNIKDGTIKNNILEHFDLNNIKLAKFSYVKRELNKPRLVVSNECNAEDIENEASVIADITSVDLNYRYITIFGDGDGVCKRLQVYSTIVKERNENFEGFVATGTFKYYNSNPRCRFITLYEMTFDESFVNVKNHLPARDIILHINLFDEYTLDNVVQWLDVNWKHVRYLKLYVKNFTDDYVQDVYNILSDMNKKLIFKVNLDDDEQDKTFR